MQTCMPAAKLSPNGATPGGGVRCGSNSAASGPNSSGSRLSACRSITTVAALGDLDARNSAVTGASARRMPGRARRVEPHRLVDAALHEQRVLAGGRASPGCPSSQPRRWSMDRTNAVALVCAPASRKKATSRRMTSGGRPSSSPWRSRVVSTSRGTSTSSPPPPARAARRRRSDRRGEELGVPVLQRPRDARPLPVLVPRRVRERGALDEERRCSRRADAVSSAVPCGRSIPAVSAARLSISSWPRCTRSTLPAARYGRERPLGDLREQLPLVRSKTSRRNIRFSTRRRLRCSSPCRLTRTSAITTSPSS